jgi:DNA invertase Pin-like site-specific DNA recombinase
MFSAKRSSAGPPTKASTSQSGTSARTGPEGRTSAPAFERAIDRAVTGETGGVVSWKIDRFSRYTEGGLRDLRRLEEAGARLAFVVEDIDTSGPMGKFVYRSADRTAVR